MTADFGKSIAASVIIHLCVCLLLLVQFILAPSVPLDLQRAIRVDVVDLPDKLPPSPAPAPTPEPAVKPPEPEKVLPTKVEPKPPDKPAVVLKPTKDKDLTKRQKDALADLKRKSALDKIRESVATDKAKQNTAEVFKGSALSKGNSPTGLEKIEYDRYRDQMHDHLLQNWNLPQWLADANLKAQALVVIDENGYVIRRQIVKPSGHELFDNNVLEAIDKSSPFPTPPRRLQGLLMQGVVFNFPE